MTEWQPLSVRRGRRQAREPQEGVPQHLAGPLLAWISGCFRSPYDEWNEDRCRGICLLMGVVPGRAGYQQALLDAAARDEELCLDIVDAVLRGEVGEEASSLKDILFLGGSVWTVQDDERGLTERVPPAEADAFRDAVAPDDIASDRLRDAWNYVYGMNRDPDGAWHQAIKAVEAVYIPIVCPTNKKANLGNVTGDLANQPQLFDFALVRYPARVSSLPALIEMIKVMWIDPNRHLGQLDAQSATQEEVEKIIPLAVTLVSWARTGVLKRRL